MDKQLHLREREEGREGGREGGREEGERYMYMYCSGYAYILDGNSDIILLFSSLASRPVNPM